ncbi:MAG: addiction module protein [Candidatus Sumerlaeaceae bacterium]|nr:addiction module protein [Candidatus Sumerlaeaceae bacterium]
MSKQMDQISLQLLSLPAQVRAELASRLIASLDDDAEENVEALWVAESQRRLEDYRADKTQARSLDEVMDSLRSLLK